MIRSLTQRLSLFVLALGLLVPVAHAQEPEQPQQPQAEEGATVDPSDEELDQVAVLLVDIEEVRENYRDELANTEDAETAQEIQEEMATEIEETVNNFDGLDADRYEEIVKGAQADLDLRDDIMARVEDERQRREENG